ncbi:MAG: PilZ domain-containing protein [Phycisphaerae bacterium]
MEADNAEASARQFVRHETHHPARLEVHPDHASQFRLNYSDAETDLAVIDVSKGGLGVNAGFYVPRNLRLTLHVDMRGKLEEGAGQVLRIRAITRRCKILDHKPTYFIGLQYLHPDDPDEQQLIRAVAVGSSTGADTAGGGNGDH